jgi:hypothetical protein
MNPESFVVSSVGKLPCGAGRAWEKVCFYEHIERQPSWILRAALPVPVRTTGAYRKVGDVSRCLYSDGGYLTKQIRRIEGHRIEFDVREQTIRYAGRIDLRGGSIEIVSHEDGTSSVVMHTRYELRARWLKPIRYFIERVIKAMHRVVMDDMHARLECAGSLVLEERAREERAREEGAIRRPLLPG